MHENELMIYLKGYLTAMSTLNSFTNDHLMAYVNVHKVDNRQSVVEVMNQICRTTDYKYEITRIGAIERELKKVLPYYTERFIRKIAETRAYPFHELDTAVKNEILEEIKAPIEEIDFTYTICDLINQLIHPQDEIYKIVVDDTQGPFYSLKDDTFLIKGDDRAIHIKFGITD